MPAPNSATSEGSERDLVAAAKEKASDPHGVRIPPCQPCPGRTPLLPPRPDAPETQGPSTVGGVPLCSATSSAASTGDAAAAPAGAARRSRDEAMRLATVATTIDVMMTPRDIQVEMSGTQVMC